MTREDFFESNTGAKYPWAASKELHNFGKGTRVTYGALDYLKKLKIVESDDVYSKAFYLEFNKLQVLEIEQKEMDIEINKQLAEKECQKEQETNNKTKILTTVMKENI